MILPMFFALSGFLIAGSAQRLKLKEFLLNRSMRIVPALAVDIFIAALVIGPSLTTNTLHSYVTDKKFAHYFLNIIGFIHYQLAGVFLSNPFPEAVNGSLWTVPFEIGCYVIMAGLIISGFVKSQSRMMWAAMGFAAIYYALHFYFLSHASPFAADNAIDHYANNFVGERGTLCILIFYQARSFLSYGIKSHYSSVLALSAATLVVLRGVDILRHKQLRIIVLKGERSPTQWLIVGALARAGFWEKVNEALTRPSPRQQTSQRAPAPSRDQVARMAHVSSPAAKRRPDR
jgi:peptidoglycan/LPS O-acetylase OafA/YrhL